MICESCIEKDKIISELKKHIEELETQMKEVREMVFKPSKKDKRKKRNWPSQRS